MKKQIANFPIKLRNGIASFQFRRSEPEVTYIGAQNTVIENNRDQNGFGIVRLHIVYLSAIDIEKLAACQSVHSFIAEYVDYAVFHIDKFAIVMPMQKVMGVSIFPDPHLHFVRIFPNFTFCYHIENSLTQS